MTDREKAGNLFDRLRYHSWFLLLLWTGCIVASLLWNLYEQREKILNIARNSAQITFENDVLYRKWAAKQGGVYVPVSEHTLPNPYLHVSDRDITTSSGLSLTLVNPAYMARQVNQMAADIHGSQGHITSLNPIRPENSPDAWEAAALKSFERSIKEVSSVEKIAGEEYMRLMRPFLTEKACLKCHASQGYKEGDIRGGISVSIPMAPLWAIERPLIAKISLAHLLLWLFGIAGILISKRGLEKQVLARERAEAVVSESANTLRIVADFTYDWEYWRSPDERFLYVSPSCERITGYTREEFVNDPELYSRIIHPDDRERVVAHLREAQGYHELCELEFRIVRRDGQERWIGHACKLVLDANGQLLGRRASDRDITEHKRADETIRSSLERLRLALDASNSGTWEWDLRTNENVWSEELWKVYGLEPYSCKPSYEAWRQTIHPDDRAIAEQVVQQAARKETDLNAEWRVRDRDETERWLMSRGRPLRDANGQVVRFIGIVTDITERKRVEQAVLEAHERAEWLARFPEENPSPVLRVSVDGSVLYRNPAAAKLPEWACEVNKPLPDLLLPLVGQAMTEQRETQQDVELGGRFYFVSVTPFPGERYANVYARDITERKQAEEALRQRTFELQQLTETLEQRVQERTSELARTNEVLRDLSSKRLSAQEEERKRIAGEIHDTLGASLSAIKFKVEDVLQKIGKTPDAATEALNTILPVVKESIDECRRIQMDLRPSMLDDLGLLPTLSWFLRRFQTIYSGIRVEQEVAIQESEIPAPLKLIAFRVTQEAMNNIAKHSHANVVRLSLRKLEGRMELVIQDNGQGFNLEKTLSLEATKRGLGLSSMRERTELSGGSFTMESTEGKGTLVRASWPPFKG